MKIERLNLHNIPAVVWGEPSDKVYIAVHGNLSNKEDTVIQLLAKHVTNNGYQLLSFDLPEHGDRKQDHTYLCKVQNCVADLKQIMDYTKQRWTSISLWACSMGAYFALMAFPDESLEQALLLSPVVDMKAIIDNLMLWSNTTESALKEKQEIATAFGQTLYWDYYCFVKEHPVTSWKCETHILYGKKDTMQTEETIRAFSRQFYCNLTVLDGAEHFFHTEQQLQEYETWLERVIMD